MVALKGKSDIGDQINKKIIAPLANANKPSDMPDFNDALVKAAMMNDGLDTKSTSCQLCRSSVRSAYRRLRHCASGCVAPARHSLGDHDAVKLRKPRGSAWHPQLGARVLNRLEAVLKYGCWWQNGNGAALARSPFP
jgi:type I restriction enzyme M protein